MMMDVIFITFVTAMLMVTFLQEDIAAKVEVIKKNAETELALLPQGKFCLLFHHVYLKLIYWMFQRAYF